MKHKTGRLVRYGEIGDQQLHFRADLEPFTAPLALRLYPIAKGSGPPRRPNEPGLTDHELPDAKPQVLVLWSKRATTWEV